MDITDEPIANHPLMKAINRAKVLNAIRRHRPVSRSEIAQRVSLDRKSITNFSTELLAEGMIREVGRLAGARGRPLTLLDFGSKGCHAIGIGIEPEQIAGVRIDFHGKVIASSAVELESSPTLSAITQGVKRVYRKLTDSSDNKPYGAGIAVPGVFDHKTTIMNESINLPCLNQQNLREVLAPCVSGRLFFEEASQAKALAEKWFGAGLERNDFVCVDLGIGVGAGIVINRRLYRGAKERGGELGHVNVARGGRQCPCGNKGCLEAYVSEKVIMRELRELGESAQRLDEISTVSARHHEVLAKAGVWLGRALATVVNVVNPSVIILNGRLMKFKNVVIAGIWEGLRECSLAASLQDTEIIASELENPTALGAATKVLSDIFEVEGYVSV